jgi:NADH:ubiquinone oxidoreductase subunit E
MGSSCFPRGNARNLDVVRGFVEDHDLGAVVRVRGDLCTGVCSRGPVVVVDGVAFEEVDPNSCLDLLRRHVLPRAEEIREQALGHEAVAEGA